MKSWDRVKTPASIFALAASLALIAACSKPAANSAQAEAAKTANGQTGQAPNGQAYSGQQGQGRPGGQGQGGGRRQAVITVQATVANAGQLTADRDTAGIIAPVIQSQVATQVAGTVLKVQKLAGEWVKAGEVVVQLDDSQLKLSLANSQAALETAKVNLNAVKDNTDQNNAKLQLQVDSAQAQVDSAQKTYNSQKALFDLGGITAAALDNAKAALATAQAALASAKLSLAQNQAGFNTTPSQNVDALKIAVQTAQNNLSQAQLNLQYASIRAPFGGQVAAMNVQPGMYVSLNTAVFTLVSAEKQIQLNVSPGDAPALPIGSTVSFEYGGKSYPVRLKQSPSAPINGVIPLVATMADGLSLPYGTVGNVSYLVPLANGILVPLSSLGTLENQNFVFAIDATNRVATKNVQIISEAGIIAAVSGLTPGDIVVVSPPPGLIPGSQVQPIMIGLTPSGSTGAAAQASPQTTSGRPGATGQSPAGATGQGGAAAAGQTGQGGGRQLPGQGQGAEADQAAARQGQAGQSGQNGQAGQGGARQWNGQRGQGQGQGQYQGQSGQGQGTGQYQGQRGSQSGQGSAPQRPQAATSQAGAQ